MRDRFYSYSSSCTDEDEESMSEKAKQTSKTENWIQNRSCEYRYTGTSDGCCYFGCCCCCREV